MTFVVIEKFTIIEALDAPPSSWMDSIVSLKMKTLEGEGIRACSLAHNILGVEGCAGVPGWELRRLKNKSITHMDLHKPNDKLVNAQLEHLWCTNKPRSNTDLQDLSWLGLWRRITSCANLRLR